MQLHIPIRSTPFLIPGVSSSIVSSSIAPPSINRHQPGSLRPMTRRIVWANHKQRLQRQQHQDQPLDYQAQSQHEPNSFQPSTSFIHQPTTPSSSNRLPSFLQLAVFILFLTSTSSISFTFVSSSSSSSSSSTGVSHLTITNGSSSTGGSIVNGTVTNSTNLNTASSSSTGAEIIPSSSSSSSTGGTSNGGGGLSSFGTTDAVFLTSVLDIWVYISLWTMVFTAFAFLGASFRAIRVNKSVKYMWIWLPPLMLIIGAAVGFVHGSVSAALIGAASIAIPYPVGIDIAAGLGIGQAICIIYFHLGRADFIHR